MHLCTQTTDLNLEKTMHKNANESMFLTAHRQKFIERKETERTIYLNSTNNSNMKKSLLFLSLSIMALCLMPRVAWAGTPTVVLNNGVLTITSDEAGQLTSEQLTPEMKACTQIVLIGKFDERDLEKLQNSQGFTAVTTVDMSEAKFVKITSSSDTYKLFSSEASGSATEGDKAIVGGDLYKLSITTSRSWDDDTYDSSKTYTTFNTTQDRDNATNNMSAGSYAQVPATYHWYKMNVSRSWAGPTTTDPQATNYEYFDPNSYSETNLPPANNYNAGSYIRFATAYNYYKMHIVSKAWTPVDESEASQHNPQEMNWSSDDLTNENNLNYNDGYYIKISNGNGGYSYYKMVITKEWQGPTTTLEGGATAQNPSFAESERDNNKTNYNEGDYIQFATAYNYYQVVETKTWEGPSDTAYTGVYSTDENPSFSESDIENNKTNYGDNSAVRFVSTYNYYVLNETTTRTWNQQSYSDGESKEISYKFADTTEMNANTTATNDQYAIVGGTEKVYKDGSWGDVSTVEEYDYSQMKFSYWSETLTTAITSKYADNNINGEIFKDCKKLTSVDYKAGNVTGFDGHKTGSGYASGLEVKIGKNVTTISSSAFKECDALTTLTFDKDYSANNADKLDGVTYPVEMTIEENAFKDCVNLSGVEIPNRVSKIGNTAFQCAGNSTSEFTVTFERRKKENDSNVSIDYDTNLTIGSGAFDGCTSLKSISLPIRLSEMGSQAFAHTTNLETMEIREDVENARLKTIPSSAFLESGITEVTIPRSVTEIQAGAFQQCFNITKITFQEQIVEEGQTQEPLIIRSGAFAGGTESAYKLKDVYVNIHPDNRKLVCEVNAFAFVSLVGQTDVTNEQRATLHFDKEDWDYYAGDWKLGLAFNQSNLNAMKDGYTDTANGYIGGVPDGSTISTETGYYETGNENTQYAPANGWQQFATTSTGIDVIIPTGNFCRSYSIPDDYYIPTVSGSDIKIARLFRVTGFDDDWKEGQDKTSQALANNATRVATVTEVTDYIPGNTGLIVVGIGTEQGYLIYQKEVEEGTEVQRYPYNADTSSGTCNLLEPVCDKNNNQPFAINPTDPYPLPAGKNSGYRIFGFMPSSKQFGRPKPNVILAADLAYLKLPVTMFHWSNEGDANSSTGYESNSGAKISLVFDLDEETTGISLRPTISQDDTTADDAWYTLQGVRVERPTAKGIYIHRGKKIMVK